MPDVGSKNRFGTRCPYGTPSAHLNREQLALKQLRENAEGYPAKKFAPATQRIDHTYTVAHRIIGRKSKAHSEWVWQILRHPCCSPRLLRPPTRHLLVHNERGKLQNFCGLGWVAVHARSASRLSNAVRLM